MKLVGKFIFVLLICCVAGCSTASKTTRDQGIEAEERSEEKAAFLFWWPGTHSEP